MKKVCVVGLGYIGLPTALIAAQHGLEVIGYDINAERIEGINNNSPLIDEPELKEILATVNSEHTFYATTQAQPADYFIITVPTPCTSEKKADLSYVHHAIKTILPLINKGNVIILESTIPVGTSTRIAQQIEEDTGMTCGVDFYFAHCPERVLPGKIFYELIHNERIIGGVTQSCVEQARSFYTYFVQAPMHAADAATAEMVKLVENSSRDVAIAFAHQVAQMAEQQGIEPRRVIELANKHPRVNILNPSCGVGGHCIALDPWFLIETFPEETELLRTARAINDHRPQIIMTKILQAVEVWEQKHGTHPEILLLGATYKPDVDDLRESPALYIAQELTKKIPTTLVCEPHVTDNLLSEKFQLSPTDLTTSIASADIVVGLVKHTIFTTINTTQLADKNVYDFCGIWYQQHPEKKVEVSQMQSNNQHTTAREFVS